MAAICCNVVRHRSSYRVALIEVYSGAAFAWAEAACFLLRLIGRPYALALHGGNLPAFAERWPGRVRRLMKSAAIVASPSSYLSEAVKRWRNDVIILPNAIQVDAYRFRLRHRADPRLIWLRAFHEIYDPVTAVKAFLQG